jgi:hypothetical protein
MGNDIGFVIEDLERLQQHLSEARHQGLPTMAVNRDNVEQLGRAAAALRAQRVEVLAEAADAIDKEFTRILGLQNPEAENDPLSIGHAVNRNIRMTAALLPDLAAKLRGMGEIRTI